MNDMKYSSFEEIVSNTKFMSGLIKSIQERGNLFKNNFILIFQFRIKLKFKMINKLGKTP